MKASQLCQRVQELENNKQREAAEFSGGLQCWCWLVPRREFLCGKERLDLKTTIHPKPVKDGDNLGCD